MLKARIVTATVLLLGLLGAFYFCSPFELSILFALVFAIAAWEWGSLASLKAVYQKGLFSIFVLVVLGVIGTKMGLPQQIDMTLVYSVVVLATCWWFVALVLIKTYPKSAFLWQCRLILLCMGLLVLVSAWLALIALLYQPEGPLLFLLILSIVALADTGAYFSGKQFGRHKLAPLVSPGKTWEGVIGGLLVNAVLYIVLIIVLHIQQEQLGWFALMLFLPALFSIVGDLFESMLKRNCGIKDSGRILPGHGGILDRVDGLVAALPVFVLILLFSGITF